jgi:lia operon protein LiaF
MQDQLKNQYFSWLILLSLFLVLMEVLFFNKGLIFSLLASFGMIYVGRKRIDKTLGKGLFWAGIFFLAVSAISMMSFRFFILSVFIYFIIQYAQSKKHPQLIRPVLQVPAHIGEKEELITREPLLKNVLFGEQKTPEHTYEWNDINIQTGVGDTVIDLSYTVLPKGETVIFIRNLIGKIQIFIPYDLEVSVHHSVIAGNADILHFHGTKLFNQNIHVQTKDYENQEQKIRIFTSMIIGDIEVRRI